MRRSIAAICIAAGLGLAACVTSTPYQPAATAAAHGYSDQMIESDRYKVGFKGNTSTPKEVVETYLLYRAAELTLQQGYDYFLIVDRDTESKSKLRPDASSYGPYHSYYGFGYSYYHPTAGWRSMHDPFWMDAPTYTEVTRYEASAEILMRKGTKPADEARAFDAREVSKNLAPRIDRGAN